MFYKKLAFAGVALLIAMACLVAGIVYLAQSAPAIGAAFLALALASGVLAIVLDVQAQRIRKAELSADLNKHAQWFANFAREIEEKNKPNAR